MSLLFLLLIIAAAGGFFVYRKRKIRQFAFQEEQRQKAILSLQSIQAQLNPHFIFNALNSIQALVNNGDIDRTNQYLTEFSILMRNTLSDHERIQNRLGAELQSMETYLRLEQLRFGFRYDFNVDPALKADDIEIPRLILQPVIENAVKHGVSGLRENGIITVRVFRSSADLKIEIQDNGPGTTPGRENSGYGLKLTRDRIHLLNQVQIEYPIDLTELKGRPATFIFTFKNWLS